ncbi:hypothetical protein K3495_g5040 [Podosphaera aphanis]|nr:hypothetical protein K3495_g5040 [Podosphaera aphanis]
MEMISLDAVNALLNSTLDEVVVYDLPPGFEVEGKKVRLQRALYGLPRSPLLWAQAVEKELRKLGFDKLLGVDCLISTAKLTKFKQALMNTFQMRECNKNRFLGIRIIRNRQEKKVWLVQDVYITIMAMKYALDHITKTSTSLPTTYGKLPDPDINLSDNYHASPQIIHEYQTKVGSIGHAAMFTRPDVAKSSLLAEHLSNPNQDDLYNANRCIQYLYSTRFLVILYHGNKGSVEVFDGAGDAAFADDSQSRRLSEAYLFRLFGGPIAWAAKKQPIVAKSTMESELAALSRPGSHHKWWERFFRSAQFNLMQDTALYCDNTAAVNIATSKADKSSTKLRHTDVHNNWLRQETNRLWLDIRYIPTAEIPADGLTKILCKQKHTQFLKQLNLHDVAHLIDE